MLNTLHRNGTIATTLIRGAAALAFASACAVSQAAQANDPAAPADASRPFPTVLVPDGFFVQFGVAEEATADTVGARWNLHSDRLRSGWGVYVEASLSRWRTRSGYPSDHGVLTQIGVIPVIRYDFAAGRSPWFVEGGIGATVTSSLYRSGSKHFSTAFNFGDHLGLGYAFGETREHEVALRIEHFSNGGIDHPNPGQNFIQLRYARFFG